MARRGRSQGSKAGGGFLFLLGLCVGAGILYLFMKPSVPFGTETAGPSRASTREPQEPRRTPRHKPEGRAPSDHVEPEAPSGTIAPAATETVIRPEPLTAPASPW